MTWRLCASAYALEYKCTTALRLSVHDRHRVQVPCGRQRVRQDDDKLCGFGSVDQFRSQEIINKVGLMATLVKRRDHCGYRHLSPGHRPPPRCDRRPRPSLWPSPAPPPRRIVVRNRPPRSWCTCSRTVRSATEGCSAPGRPDVQGTPCTYIAHTRARYSRFECVRSAKPCFCNAHP